LNFFGFSDIKLKELSEITNISFEKFKDGLKYHNNILTVYPNLTYDLQTVMARYPEERFIDFEHFKLLMFKIKNEE
jgi:hypothetical protein